MPDEQKVEKVESWTCMGVRYRGGKLVQYWARGTTDLRGWESRAIGYTGKLCHARAGMVFRMTFEQVGDTHSVFTRGPKAPVFERAHEDQDVVAEWDALSQAATTLAAAATAAKRVTPVMYSALDPVRRAMWKTNSTGRRAILANVVEYLTRLHGLNEED